jgi:DNA-binding NarL/FixJ family response regulator
MGTSDAAAPRILLIDEQPIVRDALARLVAEADPRAVVLEAPDAAAGAALLAAQPDVALVILDVGAQAAAAPVLLRRLRGEDALLRVVVMAADDDPALARVVLEEGARGFVSKRASTALLREVLRLVLAGGVYVPPAAAGVASPLAHPLMPLAARPPARAPEVRLTARQRMVLALLLRGHPNKLICRALALREGTVKTHIANIFRSLDVRNRTEAAYAAARLGIDLPEVEERPPRAASARPPLKLVAKRA